MKYKILLLAFTLSYSLTARRQYAEVLAQALADKLPYHVIGQNKSEGLFSCFLGVLNELYRCEKANKTPIVYWDKSSLYFSQIGFNNSENVWEYYFEPVSAATYHKGDYIHNKIIHSFFNYTLMEPATRNEAFRLISTYIKIKPSIQKKIDTFYEQQMMNNKKTIGIHLRGTDKQNSKSARQKMTDIQRHANIMDLLNRIKEIALLNADENTQFLITGDEQSLFNEMIKLLSPYKIINYDCYRSTDKNPLHKSMYFNNTNMSRAQCGEDVVVEAMLLSKCDLLIHTPSSVSTTVLYFNPSLNNILLR